MSSVERAQAGRPFDVAIRVTPDPNWHVYWHSPRDGGMPTEVSWDLPEGFKAGPLRWPVPRRFEEEGDLVSYGYDGEFWLLAEVIPPKGFAGKATLAAEVSWLVCKETCYPGGADLSLDISVDAGAAEPSKYARPIELRKAGGPESAAERRVAVVSKVSQREGVTVWNVRARLGETPLRGTTQIFPFDPPQARIEEPRFSWEHGELTWSTGVRVGGTQFKPTDLAALIVYQVAPPKKQGEDANPRASAPEKAVRRAVVVRHCENR